MSSAKWQPFCLGLNVLTFEMLAVREQQQSFWTHERMFLWSANYIYYMSWSHINIKLNIR